MAERKDRERDSSPSAFSDLSQVSQSSSAVLEWDPSADVGASPPSDDEHEHQQTPTPVVNPNPPPRFDDHSKNPLILLGILGRNATSSQDQDQDQHQVSTEYVHASQSAPEVRTHFHSPVLSSNPSDAYPNDQPLLLMGILKRKRTGGNRSGTGTSSSSSPPSPNQEAVEKNAESDHLEHESSPSDETNPPTIKETDTQNAERVVSEASTDWEFGHSARSLSRNVSSLSDWQNDGMTKSEIEYQKRRGDGSSSSNSGSYSVQIQIEQPGGSKNNLADADFFQRPRSQSTQSEEVRLKVNKSVQTDESVFLRKKIKSRPRVADIGTSYSTKFAQTQESLFEISTTKVSKENVPPKETSKPKIIKRVSERDRIPPKARREREHEHEVRKWVAQSSSSDDVVIKNQSSSSMLILPQKISSSELSETCDAIQRIVKRDPKTQQEFADLVDAHRDSHVSRVRKELRRLEKLNALMDGPIITQSQQQQQQLRQQLLPLTSSTTSQEETQHQLPLRPAAQPLPRPTTRQEPVSGGVEEKIEHLLDRFDLLTELVLLKEEGNMKHKSGRNHSTSTPIQSFSSDEALKENNINRLPRYMRNTSDFTREPTHSTFTRQTRQAEQAAAAAIRKKAICYFLPFNFQQIPFQSNGFNYNNGVQQNEPQYHNGDDCKNIPSLQDVFRENRPEFIERAQRREAILTQLREEREHRARMKRNWLQQNNFNTSALDQVLPPKGPRVMTTREMRELTKKKYKMLPEVQEQKLQRKAEEEKRFNRLISQVFAKKLRQGVLKGDPNFNPNKSVIRK